MILKTSKNIIARVLLGTVVSVRLPLGHRAHVLRVQSTTPPECFALIGPGMVD
jgi:hypothetical protein